MLLVPVNLIECTAVVEVRLLRLLPAAKHRVHGEQLKLWKIRTGFGRSREPWAEVMPRDYFLPLPAVEIFQIRFGHCAGAVPVCHFVDQGDGRFRQNTGRRIDDLEPVVAELVERQVCFVSHASRTSPIPRSTKVVVEPRAPESSTGTFRYKLVTKSLAFDSS